MSFSVHICALFHPDNNNISKVSTGSTKASPSHCIFWDLAFNNVAHAQSAWMTVIKLGRKLAHHYGTRRGQPESTCWSLRATEHNISVCWLAHTEHRRSFFPNRGNCPARWYQSIVIWCFQHHICRRKVCLKGIRVSGRNSASMIVMQNIE